MGVVVHADFVSGPEGLSYFDLGQERVFQSPGLGLGVILEDDGEDEKSLLSHGGGGVEGEAHEVVAVLDNANDVHVEDQFGLDVFEQFGKDVFFLFRGQVGLKGDLVICKIEVGCMCLGEGLVVDCLLKKGSSEVGLDDMG